jgi:hypothetical protein
MSDRGRCDHGQGPVAGGDVDGLVVGNFAGEAVPEDLKAAVAEGSQGRVVVLAAGALGVVELPGSGGAAQAVETPTVHGVGEVAVFMVRRRGSSR